MEQTIFALVEVYIALCTDWLDRLLSTVPGLRTLALNAHTCAHTAYSDLALASLECDQWLN
jgi:hypothetical protein